MTTNENAGAARQVHEYLTRKAKARLDGTAIVYERQDGRWFLERSGQPDRDIGENFGRAKEALQQLIASSRSDREIDLFICHADSDKTAAALPLARALVASGLKVWIDDEQISLGDGLSEAIDHGLTRCRWGVVILSQAFFARNWPRRELDALAAREAQEGRKVILPVWHGLDVADVARYSPLLAGRRGVKLERGVDAVCEAILFAISAASPAAHLEESEPKTRYRENADGTFTYWISYTGAVANVDAFSQRLRKLTPRPRPTATASTPSLDLKNAQTRYDGPLPPATLEALALSDGVTIRTWADGDEDEQSLVVSTGNQ